MYGSIITWCVDPPLTNPIDREELVRSLMGSSIGPARNAGAIDIIMTEIETDLIFSLSMYDTLDEAFTAGHGELVKIAHQFESRLHLISRVVGRAYDPPGFDLVERSEMQQWRDDASAMHSTVATWRLDSSLRGPDTLDAFLEQRMGEYLALLRDLGLLDMHVVRLADDVIVAVHFYAEPIESNAAFNEAITATQEVLGSKVALVKGHTGRAFDVPQLLGDLA